MKKYQTYGIQIHQQRIRDIGFNYCLHQKLISVLV